MKVTLNMKNIFPLIFTVFLLQGCETLNSEYQTNEPFSVNRDYDQDLISKLDIPDFSKKEYLKDYKYSLTVIDKNNYKDIFKHKKTDIYQHPFYKSRPITIVFYPSKELNKKLSELGLIDSYSLQYSQWEGFPKMLNSEVSAVHLIAQNNKDNDANLTLFNNDSKNKRDPYYHHAYFLYQHELAHSLNSQFYFLLKNKNNYLFLENFSEASASILTFQLIMEEGFNSEYFSLFLNRERKKAISFSKHHKTQQMFFVMQNLIKENPEYFLNLTYPEIEDFCFNLSKSIVLFDYNKNKSGIQDLRSKESDKYVKNIKRMSIVLSDFLIEYNLKMTL